MQSMKNVTKTNVLFTTTVLVYIILVYAVRLIPQEHMTLNLLLVLPEVILLIPSLLYIIVLRPKTVDGVNMSHVSPGTFLMTILMTYLLMPLISLINMVSSTFAGNTVDNTLNLIVNNNPLWLNLVIMALLPAVVEEFIFRGLIFNGYKKRNPFIAVILSSVLFGLIHMNINQFSYAFVIGVVFALLAYTTGSLIPSIVAHFTINGTSVALSHLMAGMEAAGATDGAEAAIGATDYISMYAIMAVMAAGGVALAVLVFRYICRKNRGIEGVVRIFRKPFREIYDEEEGKFFDGYLLLGVGICLVYIIWSDIIVKLMT